MKIILPLYVAKVNDAYYTNPLPFNDDDDAVKQYQYGINGSDKKFADIFLVGGFKLLSGEIESQEKVFIERIENEEYEEKSTDEEGVEEEVPQGSDSDESD